MFGKLGDGFRKTGHSSPVVQRFVYMAFGVGSKRSDEGAVLYDAWDISVTNDPDWGV